MSGARRRAAALAVALLAVAAIASIGQASGAFTSSQARPIAGTDRAETLIGTPGPDTIRGGHGADFLHGGPDGAVLVGGPGRDRFNMTPEGAQLRGGGDEVIRARDGRPDAINCGDGDDVAYVDRVEDGIYDCERVVPPPGSAGPARGER